MPTFRQDNKLGDSVPLIKTPDIGDKQVTERKLADGSVTSSKLSTEIANMLSLLTTRISAFKVADNLSSLPTEENTIGWLVDNHLYVYVGNGSTPESGMYQDCGELRGPQGIQGEQGLSGLNGKSAYDIWTEQPGNEDKSEIDFLEFTRGSKGDKGDQGERGYDISNIEQIVKSTEDGGKNVIRVTRSDGWSKVFEILNGSKGSKGDKGTSIVKLEQTRKTTESSGLNTIEATLDDGTKKLFEIYNGVKGEQGDKGDKGEQGEIGPQGNSGIADASNKVLVNDAITGGETDFLSAEVGKLGILTYDCSKGGSVTHATLQDAINSVPTTFQKVGLAITYKSGDTVYRYTLKANVWSADPANWFSVEDKLCDLSDNTEFRDEENNVVKTPFSMIDSPEFLVVEKDAEGKVLAATYNDGSHYAHNMKSETIPTEFSYIEDPECRTEITTDAENKVLGYRDQEGARHEKKIIAESISSKEIDELKQSTSSLDELKAVRYNEIESIRGFIRDEMFVDYYTCKLFPIKGGDVITIKGANSNCAIAFLTDNILAFNQKPNFSTAEGFNTLIPLGIGQKTIVSPTDARYFYWEASGYETSVGGATDFIPLSFFINGIDYLNPFIDSIATLSKSMFLLEDNHATDFISEEDAFFKKVKLLSNKNMLQFFAHSDSHYNDYNPYVYNHAGVYAKICENMGFAFQVHLGDVFDNTKNRDSDLMRLSKMCSLWQNSNTPFMYVQGNHETFYGDLTKDEIFGAASVFNKYIEIHRKTDDETSSLYFYFDNDNAKIRCFCLDSCIPTCGYSDKEVEWIKESIESLPSGYGVVMFCHIPFIREALWKNHANVPNDSVIREYLKGKVDAGLNLIAVIHGHMHWDNVVYSNDLKCPFISVASDKFDGLNKDYVPEGSNPYVPSRSTNTFEQYLADSFNIDKDSDKVIAIRFGAGKDRYIHRGTLQLSDSISLPTTSIVPTKWYAKDEGLITIDNEKITKVTTGNTILYAENGKEIEFWNIIIL